MSEQLEKKPSVDFIGVGAPRCGTTWLSNLLQQHPDVCFARPKETHFFDNTRAWQRGFDFYSDCFKHCGNERLRGEFTTAYLADESALYRIKQNYPNAKLIVMLRNPIERAFSQYIHSKRRNIALPPFDTFLSDPNGRFIHHGYYAKHLRILFHYFDHSQVHVSFFEDVESHPEDVYNQVCTFLDIEPSANIPDLRQRVNSAVNTQFGSKTVHYVLKKIKRQSKVRWSQQDTRSTKRLLVESYIPLHFCSEQKTWPSNV